MLKQILRDMYVDPEILAELDETYKQTLFCRMREEQIRRWKIWDEEQQKQLSEKKSSNEIENDEETGKHNKEKYSNSAKQKNVSFKTGADGQPWVWVMGEHPSDVSIEEILEQEAKQKARHLAETEFRKSIEVQLNIIEYNMTENTKKTPFEDDNNIMMNGTKIIDDMDIYCSVDELKERAQKLESSQSLEKQLKEINNIKNHNNNNNINSNSNNNNNANKNISSNNTSNSSAKKFTPVITSRSEKLDVLQEISYNIPIEKVSARIAQWEQRAIGQRTSEIFKQIQKKKAEVAKEAEEIARREEELWREQERKAKEAEVQRREIARRAREEHRKSMTLSSTESETVIQTNVPTSESKIDVTTIVTRPQNQDAVKEWYKTKESRKQAGLDEQGQPEKWFHGLLKRTEAEELLSSEEQGTFLVRISEKIWGYAISYRDIDRCKHYLVDASTEKYRFLGQNQLEHETLGDLIRYHINVPITVTGNELLIRPCSSKSSSSTILKGLS